MVTPLFISPNESNKPTQETINFWVKDNVVYTIFQANAWSGVTTDNFPVVLFQKKTYKHQLCYHLLPILKPSYKPLHVYTLKFWEKMTFYLFSKKRLFSVFLHIEVQLSLKNAWLPPVFFLDFNSQIARA